MVFSNCRFLSASREPTRSTSILAFSRSPSSFSNFSANAYLVADVFVFLFVDVAASSPHLVVAARLVEGLASVLELSAQVVLPEAPQERVVGLVSRLVPVLS